MEEAAAVPMGIGAYADGRVLDYDATTGRFTVGGAGVSADDVRAWDGAGHLTWRDESARAWFHEHHAPVLAHTAAPAGPMNPVPKCLRCGHVGPWTVEPLLLPHHIVLTLLFLLLWGGGIVYLIIVLIVRGNAERRAKICANCKSRNMFSFQY